MTTYTPVADRAGIAGARWLIPHPEWDAAAPTEGFSFMLEGIATANDRAAIKAVLLSPPIHVAPRRADRGKPRSLLLWKGTKVISEFELDKWVEGLAKRVADVLGACDGNWHKADSYICKEIQKLPDSRVA